VRAGEVGAVVVGRSSEAERSVPRACLQCATDLTNRRTGARFCSDRCRTGYNREQQRDRLRDLVAKIEELMIELKVEIDGEAA
jgi:predicted nucleic acid-binding Zn ribbon protein